MARVTHAAQAVEKVGDTAKQLTMTAADPTNKEQTAITGSSLIVAHNTGTGAVNVTLTAVADADGRTITSVSSVGADEIWIFGPHPADGWKQTDGNLYFEAAGAGVKFAVVNIG